MEQILMLLHLMGPELSYCLKPLCSAGSPSQSVLIRYSCRDLLAQLHSTLKLPTCPVMKAVTLPMFMPVSACSDPPNLLVSSSLAK